MRKWVIIGLVVLVIGGGIVAVVCWSRRDSVEYHIRAYREADRKLSGEETFVDELRDVWRKMWSQRMGRKARLRNEMHQHKEDLIRLGYLEERTFGVSNASLSDVMAAAQKAVLKKGTNSEFFSAATLGTSAVRVVAAKGMVPTWDEIAQELEKNPPKGK